jgi:uncharacterized membrane protein YfcA
MPSPELLIPVLGIVFLGGMVQGLSGFGSALVAVPLLALLIPVATVVPLVALLGLAISAANLWHLRASVRPAAMTPLLVGYVMGTPLGLYALTRAPERWVLTALGVLLSAYALLSLWGRRPRLSWLRRQRLGVGMASGALGAAFSTNGPPVILYVAAHREWGPDRQKATLVLFFLLSSVVTVAAHAARGLIGSDVVGWLLWSLPTLSLGTWTGIRLYGRLGEHDYKRLTHGLILVAGLTLCFRGLTE